MKSKQKLFVFHSSLIPPPSSLMLRATVRRLLAIDDPPERTALAFSIGVFIAFSPFLGLHTIMATVLAFAFRFNKIAIYAGTFVNNPFLTLVPIILASYAMGAIVMGLPLSLPRESMMLLRHPHLFTGEWWERLFESGRHVLLPYFLGGMMLAVVCSLAAYPLTLRFVRAKQIIKEKIEKIRHEHEEERLEEKQESKSRTQNPE